MIGVGNKIKELLKEKEITIKTLAEQTGYTRQGLSVSLKNGDFKVSSLAKFAKVLDINICEFFTDSGTTNFENEVKYFIEMFNPSYYRKILPPFVIDAKKYLSRTYIDDEFLLNSFEHIYTDLVINKVLNELNEKHNINIMISGFSLEASNDLGVSYRDKPNGRYKHVEIDDTHMSYLEDFLDKVYENIDIDIDYVKKDIIVYEVEFMSFVTKNSFIDWYKKVFAIEEVNILRIATHVTKNNPLAMR